MRIGAEASVRFGAVVVGGGPAGAGLLLAARGAGMLDALLDRSLCIIERGTAVGAGELGSYAIRSDSNGESFLRALEAPGTPPLSPAFETPAGREMLRQRGGPVPLATAATFLAGGAEGLRAALAATGRDPFLTGHEAVSANMSGSDGWRVLCRGGDGREIALEAASLVLATGADQPSERLEREVVAGRLLLPRFAGKVVQSSEVLSRDAGAAVRARLAALPSPKVTIVGASHSAIACARLLLDAAPELGFGEGGVAMLHRQPLRLTYQSPAEALADGFGDFGPDDICARSGRVFPLAGFRNDARDLLRRVWNLGGCGPEPRLHLHRLAAGADAEADRLLAEADLIIAAFGYRPRALPLFDAAGARIALLAETGGPSAPLVDARSRVLDADGVPVAGVYGIGLAAGYPLRGTHGEASFQGQANGLSLWHGEVGAAIVRDLLAVGAEPAPSVRRLAEQHA